MLTVIELWFVEERENTLLLSVPTDSSSSCLLQSCTFCIKAETLCFLFPFGISFGHLEQEKDEQPPSDLLKRLIGHPFHVIVNVEALGTADPQFCAGIAGLGMRRKFYLRIRKDDIVLDLNNILK